jgi:hypothetical protein
LSLAAVRDLRVVAARAPVTVEDLAALQTDVLAGYVFAQAAAGAGKAGQEAGRFIRATASPDQLELLARRGAVASLDCPRVHGLVKGLG